MGDQFESRSGREECRGAIILAGGDSRRLGQPKAQLDFGGSTLLERVVDRLRPLFTSLTLVTDRPELYSFLPVEITSDLIDSGLKSPLRGIHAGLSLKEFPCQFVVACDMPFLNRELIEYMLDQAGDFDAVVPKVGSFFQPLHAVYSRRCIPLIEDLLDKKRYKVTDFYEHLSIRYITPGEIRRFDPGEISFTNINTWEEYQVSLEMIRRSRV